MPFRIEYTPVARDHLRGLTARQQSTVLNSVDRQLAHEPNVETRNRKRMRANPVAPWELRVGDLRVYYDVGEGVVTVVAVGMKRRNLVYIGGKAINL